ncbi:MAG: 2-hydroxychromene-2-carboxylate isomerase [Sneathiella sp.]
MSEIIEFYFDFSSPYAYLGSKMIEAVAEKHGRTVEWRSFMLGTAFKGENTGPLTIYPRKGEYSLLDFDRTARKYDIPFNMPSEFPKLTILASRGFYWLCGKNTDLAKEFAQAVFAAYFVEGQDISSTEVILDIVRKLPIDEDVFSEAVQDKDLKDAYKTSVVEIVDEKKVFGAPFFIVDGEPFWGADRIVQIDEWLSTGGW